jgi:hypothetical protein
MDQASQLRPACDFPGGCCRSCMVGHLRGATSGAANSEQVTVCGLIHAPTAVQVAVPERTRHRRPPDVVALHRAQRRGDPDRAPDPRDPPACSCHVVGGPADPRRRVAALGPAGLGAASRGHDRTAGPSWRARRRTLPKVRASVSNSDSQPPSGPVRVTRIRVPAGRRDTTAALSIEESANRSTPTSPGTADPLRSC